ncbi:putative pectinesterase 11 [Nicotiana tabacum]|uniref:pectinesterase n=2 Tax=Nicotiana TaxID=4085 RepID=A0A1S4DP75_TOBAC|nr:PREDICTED: putative pectinesterase 11 [Nicotiana sylvestris]XP_009778332.1 PREDICTED: putative pectinesterase 11 [Nicotiana sylvestris]XP_016515223.1 PREDICTED: putative pectinesterase 11 [Nicotiana tabacum]XP_016515224.1 PREDICTED: putative pectinesterase 11 [Nicotiana tabacum]
MAFHGYTAMVVVILAMSYLLICSEADSNTQLSTAILIKVDQSGNGDFKKIQDAIDAVPSHNSQHIFISVKPGIYREKIVVPADKPFITISGRKPVNNTIITGNDFGDIFESSTFTVFASDFVARHLTIQNTYGTGAKAVALRVEGDRVGFVGCRIKSHQDTLLDDVGRHYYKNCYIEGDTDFICGNGASLFEKCHLHSLSEGNGAITAQHRQSSQENTGFTFVGCKITGVKSAILGRPWGPYARVVFAQTYMSSVILPYGWEDWNVPSRQRTSYFAEYKCYGPGASSDKRVNWLRTLSSEDAVPYLKESIMGPKSWIRSKPTHLIPLSKAISTSFNKKRSSP